MQEWAHVSGSQDYCSLSPGQLRKFQCSVLNLLVLRPSSPTFPSREEACDLSWSLPQDAQGPICLPFASLRPLGSTLSWVTKGQRQAHFSENIPRSVSILQQLGKTAPSVPSGLLAWHSPGSAALGAPSHSALWGNKGNCL